MKKTVIISAALAVLAACGGDEKKDEKTSTTTEQKAEATTDDLSNNPIYQKAITIIANSDCRTCHLIDEKNIGPAWREVANKYAGQDTAVQYLAHKIINGGSGVWGQVPMAPHPTMTQEDAETLAQYVMLLKNK
ncbi:MAG TPA: c-type cytochrome [Chitinophagaceae bacterium]|nr:c-type cytochrome [Chitinophagaceae bacterium]